MKSRDRNAFALILALFAAALALRFYRLGYSSLNLEETATWWLALHPINNKFWQACASDNTPPLFQLLVHFWIKLFGDSEFSLRTLPAIFGALSVAAIYRLGAEVYSQRVGWVAAVLLAIAPRAVEFSRECRSISLFLLLTIASLQLWNRMIVKASWKSAFALALINALACYTHYMGYVLVTAEAFLFFVWMMSEGELDSSLNYLLSLAMTAALASPWFGTFAVHRVLSAEHFWIAPPSLSTALSIFGFSFGSYWILGLFSLLFLRFILVDRFSKIDARLFLLALAYFLLILFKSLVSTSIFHPRYFFTFLPIAIIFFARTLEAVKDKRTFLAFILLASTACGAKTISQIGRSFYFLRSAVNSLGQNHQPTLVLAPDINAHGLDYHLRHLHKTNLTIRYFEMNSKLPDEVLDEIRTQCVHAKTCLVDAIVSNRLEEARVLPVLAHYFASIRNLQTMDPETFRLRGFNGANR